MRKRESIWTEREILNNIKLFYEKNNHFPTAYEIDECNYLPTSRQIQRKFKGLINLRNKLKNIDNPDLRKGDQRSIQMQEINKRSLELENKLSKELVARFGEPFVHFQKPINRTKRRYDFYVYCKNTNFAIDVFFPAHIRSINGIINIKLGGGDYPERELKIYFICMNSLFNQKSLNQITANKFTKLPRNIELVSIDYFLNRIINLYKPYQLV